MAQRLLASHGMEVVAGGCWHGMEVVAMAWLMLFPWRGSQVVGIAWLTGCHHGVAHRLSASHGSKVVGMAWRLSPWHGLCVACIGMAWCSGFVRLLTL